MSRGLGWHLAACVSFGELFLLRCLSAPVGRPLQLDQMSSSSGASAAAASLPPIAPFHGSDYVHPERTARLRRVYLSERAAAQRDGVSAAEAAAAAANANAAASAAHPMVGAASGGPKSEDAKKQSRGVLVAFLAHEDDADGAGDEKLNYRALYGSAAGGVPERLSDAVVATEVFWKDFLRFMLVVYKSPSTKRHLAGSTVISHCRDMLHYFAELDVARTHDRFYEVLTKESSCARTSQQ